MRYFGVPRHRDYKRLTGKETKDIYERFRYVMVPVVNVNIQVMINQRGTATDVSDDWPSTL